MSWIFWFILWTFSFRFGFVRSKRFRFRFRFCSFAIESFAQHTNQKKDESLEKSIIQAKGEQLPTSDERIVQLQQEEQIEDIELQQNLEEQFTEGTTRLN